MASGTGEIGGKDTARLDQLLAANRYFRQETGQGWGSSARRQVKESKAHTVVWPLQSGRKTRHHPNLTHGQDVLAAAVVHVNRFNVALDKIADLIGRSPWGDGQDKIAS